MWHWEPYAYSKTADDTDGAPVKPLPKEVADLARAAVAEAYGRDCAEAAAYAPDAAIVNLYAPGAHLGLHQDGEEPSDAPVVTVSLGDSCIFRFAGVGRRTGPFTDLELRSGDLLVFGEPNRRIHHGVPKVLDGTAPGGLGLPPGVSRLLPCRWRPFLKVAGMNDVSNLFCPDETFTYLPPGRCSNGPGPGLRSPRPNEQREVVQRLRRHALIIAAGLRAPR